MIEKMDMKSMDITEENVKKIQALFPNAVTEVIVDGKTTLKIDFDVLKQELSESLIEDKQERYQMTWPDKSKAKVLANSRITSTLRPDKEKSVDFDNTQNLYIEGDNLDVLKLLRETYLGKVKMIYIDPPYNTGEDFVYNDRFAISMEDYMGISGQIDESGNRLVKNMESNGRFHTDWLNMLYPRLKVSKDLLTDDGIIFISIDDSEVRNLKILCDEIFGENNFIAQLIWQNKKGGGNDSKYIAIEHEYVLCYARNINMLAEFYEKYSDDYIKRYKECDEIGRYFWDTFKRKSGKQYYPIVCPDGTVLEKDEDGNAISWLRSQERFKSDLQQGEVRIIKIGGKWSVQFKQRIPLGKTPRSIFTTNTVVDDKGTTSSGAEDVYKYFLKDVFSNPKPVNLIYFLLGFAVQPNDLVLDFFSGSGTTAEAVIKMNATDGGKRKFILIQLPEEIRINGEGTTNANRVSKNAIEVLDELKRAHHIANLAEERIRRAGAKIKEENGLTADKLDTGFRVLKLDSSNMQDVYYNPMAMRQSLLDETIDNVKSDRTPLDLLFQVMLDLGVELSAKIEEKQVNDKTYFVVNGNDLIACFDEDIDNDVITEIAKQQPLYAVFKSTSFATDSASINNEQLFKTYSPATVIKVI